MIDVCCTHSYVVNFVVTDPNLTRYLHNVEQLLPVNLLQSELRYCSPFRNAGERNEGGSANCGRVAEEIAHSTFIIFLTASGAARQDLFQNITTFEVNVTSCDLENSFIFDNET